MKSETTYQFTVKMTQAEVEEAMNALDPIMRESFEFKRMKASTIGHSTDGEELRLMIGAFHALGVRLPLCGADFMEWAEVRDDGDTAVDYVGDYFFRNSKKFFEVHGVDVVEREIEAYRLRQKTFQFLALTNHTAWQKVDAAEKHIYACAENGWMPDGALAELKAARAELEAVVEARMKLAA